MVLDDVAIILPVKSAVPDVGKFAQLFTLTVLTFASVILALFIAFAFLFSFRSTSF